MPTNNQKPFDSSYDNRNEQRSSSNAMKDKERSPLARFFIELGSIIFHAAIIATIVFIIQYFFFASVKVEGNSMNPTLDHGDRLILNKLAEPERFSIVVFEAPDEEKGAHVQYIKRIIGMPGDTIEMSEDQLYLNGEEVSEYYLPDEIFEHLPYYYTGDFTLESLLDVSEVPEGTYFVLGDNRLNSKDSRTFGFIDQESVTGRVDIRYWPFNHFGKVE